MTSNLNKKEFQVRQIYEPVQMEMINLTQQGVLCQSDGSTGEGTSLEQYNQF